MESITQLSNLTCCKTFNVCLSNAFKQFIKCYGGLLFVPLDLTKQKNILPLIIS